MKKHLTYSIPAFVIGLLVAGALNTTNGASQPGVTMGVSEHGQASPDSPALGGTNGSPTELERQPHRSGHRTPDVSAAVAPTAVVAPAEEVKVVPATVEATRRKWSKALDTWERRLRPLGPPDADDAVLWSRWEDLRRARVAFADAETADDMNKLAKGEFKSVFKVQ